MRDLTPYIVANPWKSVGIALVVGAVVALELPGSGHLFKALRGLVFRELAGQWLGG